MTANARAMHIVVPIHSFEPGGVERVALNLASAWQAEGSRVSVVLGRRDGATRAVAPKLTYVCRDTAWSTASFETLWLILQLWRFLRTERADVIFCPGNTYTIVCAVMRLLLGANCPPIVAKISNDLTRRDMIAPVRWGYRVWLIIQGHVIDRFVGMAEPMRSEIADAMKVPPERIDIVADPGLTHEQYKRLSHLNCATNRSETRDFLAVGRLVEQKNFPLMIRAFAEAASSRSTLTILGEGPERPKLRALIQQLRVERRVRLIGHVTDTTPWYRSSTALLLSSNFEGVPAVVLEALATGIPMIATDCSTFMRNLLADHRFGILTPVGDVEAFGNAIGRFDPAAFDRVAALLATMAGLLLVTHVTLGALMAAADFVWGNNAS